MTVHLVGAGPGDPDLLTLRAASLLARADVIVHDRLVDRRILASAAPWAELVDVGKSPGSRRNSQAEINAIEDRDYTVFRGNSPLTDDEAEMDGISFQTWGVGRSMRFAAVGMSTPLSSSVPA